MPELDNLNALTGFLLGIVGLIAAAVTWVRWVRPRMSNASRTWVAVKDTFLGREAIKDSITGREIEPSQPPMGIRLANLEGTVSELVKQDARLSHVEARVTQNEDDIAELKNSRVERVATQLESAAMWEGVGRLHDEPPNEQHNGPEET